jgi:hypothetical protein
MVIAGSFFALLNAARKLTRRKAKTKSFHLAVSFSTISSRRQSEFMGDHARSQFRKSAIKCSTSAFTSAVSGSSGNRAGPP